MFIWYINSYFYIFEKYSSQIKNERKFLPFYHFRFSATYFSRVAIPPRKCRSLKLNSSTFLTRSYKSSSIYLKRSETSLCTVDLLIEKCAEHARTVAPVSTIYSAHLMALSSIYSHKIPTSVRWLRNIICRFFEVYNWFYLLIPLFYRS